MPKYFISYQAFVDGHMFVEGNNMIFGEGDVEISGPIRSGADIMAIKKDVLDLLRQEGVRAHSVAILYWRRFEEDYDENLPFSYLPEEMPEPDSAPSAMATDDPSPGDWIVYTNEHQGVPAEFVMGDTSKEVACLWFSQQHGVPLHQVDAIRYGSTKDNHRAKA